MYLNECLLRACVAGVLALSLGCRQAHRAGSEHEEHERHEGEEAHGEGHDGGHADEVSLTLAQLQPRTAAVSRADIDLELTLTAEVSLDEEKLAHVHPRVPGIAVRVLKALGDSVRKGDALAVIESQDLAEAVAEYLAARESLALAEATYRREEGLWKKKVTSEQEYLGARAALTEAGIELRSAEQALHALGLSDREIDRIAEHPGESSSRYPITAPLDGTVIEKHLTQGELVGEEEVFTVADLDTVWLLANVHEKDMGRVREGQSASVVTQAHPDRRFEGKVTWIAATIDEESRTLKIRVELDNRERLLRPGMFARVHVAAERKEGVLTVPPSAVLTDKDETFVFVEGQRGHYERRDVRVGVRAADAVEVLEGLQEGEKVVTSGGFLLESELAKAGFEAGHVH
jgi:cobalt-zinc-cadmium efflux system membrane fusion protein